MFVSISMQLEEKTATPLALLRFATLYLPVQGMTAKPLTIKLACSASASTSIIRHFHSLYVITLAVRIPVRATHKKRAPYLGPRYYLAESWGFEPQMASLPYSLSRRAPSASRSALHVDEHNSAKLPNSQRSVVKIPKTCVSSCLSSGSLAFSAASFLRCSCSASRRAWSAST